MGRVGKINGILLFVAMIFGLAALAVDRTAVRSTLFVFVLVFGEVGPCSLILLVLQPMTSTLHRLVFIPL